jgi:radical SAM superfamily enzyme YgiQ (UPF0313 family)
MKITFICPSLTEKRLAQDMQPLAFAVLASLTPPDVEVVLYDERLEAIPYSEPTDLVALTVETLTASHAYEIAARYRQCNIPIVMGGYHPTLAPEEALLHADAIVIGEAEQVWPVLIQDAKAGHLQRIYQSKRLQNIAGIHPDRRIFQGKSYHKLIPIEYGRGCRYACDFCSNHAFWGPGLCHRPISDVIAEIESLGSKFLCFVDDNFFSNPLRARELCEALLPLKVHWFCQTSLDTAENQEILDLMARSGCFGVLIGIESLEERNLIQMGKKANLKRTDYATLIQRFHDKGILIFANFVFGYDYDTPGAFATTYEFALRSKFYLAQFNPLVPAPGTELYNRLKSEKRLLYDSWWTDPNYRYGQAAFIPRGMTPDELTAGCADLNHAYYSYRTIFQRMLHPGAWGNSLFSLGIFTIGNFILRQEIYHRFGLQIARSDSEKAAKILPYPASE